MKGFIDVTLKGSEKRITLNPMMYDFLERENTCLIASPSVDNYSFETKESYEEIKQLIKEATEL